jgi:hypothetical protein
MKAWPLLLNYSALHPRKPGVLDLAEIRLSRCVLEGGDQGVEDVDSLLLQSHTIRADDAVALHALSCSKAAETFFFTLGIRTACSTKLLVNCTLVCVMKRHTSLL